MKEIKLPKAYEQEMQRLLGEKYDAYLETFQKPVRQGLRLNRCKLTNEAWEKMTPFPGEAIPWVENGYYVETKRGDEEGESPSRHPFYYAGLYYIQEPSAMTPASRLPVDKGDRILDLCAAPGGKATELAGKLDGSGLLLANDLSSSRAKALLKNLEQMGAKNIYVTSETPERLQAHFPAFFHKILIDAPCSGEGMFHKEPKMAEYWEEKPPQAYAETQKKLVLAGADMLMPGGMLLYSTCTFSKKENEEVIAYLLQERQDMEVTEIAPYEGFSPGFALDGESEACNRALSRCVRIFPHHMPGEGHFLALLHKKGSQNAEKTAKSVSCKPPACAEEFFKSTALDFSDGYFQMEKEKLYFLPGNIKMPRLRYLRTGLYMGEVKKNRFVPSQALAMALSPDTFVSCINFSREDIRVRKYLKGETLMVSDLPTARDKGWQLVCVEGFALGFGKLERGLLKNKYYAGWRIQ